MQRSDPIFPSYCFALKFPDGTYFNGQRDSYNPALVNLPYCGNRQQAYTYTEQGAYAKRDSDPSRFAACIVERIL